MLGMGLVLQQNLAARQSLIQKLGLESEYLDSCLVRSEALLKELRYQRPLTLIRHLAEDSRYNSVLDFLLAVFMPSMKPHIEAYYDDRGERLNCAANTASIDRIDRRLASVLMELEQLYTEMLRKKWARTRRKYYAVAWTDLFARPSMPFVELHQRAA